MALNPQPEGHGRENEKYVRFLDHAQREEAIVALGNTQHLVFSLAQLVELGVTPRAIQMRAETARLHRIHRTVYSLVPEPCLTRNGRYMAAVLACGDGAVLSHRNAAALHELRSNDRARIEVTVPKRSARRHKGVQLHRSTTLTQSDVTIKDGIPTTTVARTLLDLASVLPRRPVERAFDQADAERTLNLLRIQDQLARNPNHRGGPIIRSILAEHYIGKTATASELEEAMFALCRRTGMPLPEVNQWVDFGDGEPPIKADFLWRAHRLIVETDGAKYHGTHQARQRDPRRDQRAMLAGWRPIRTTWRQVIHRPRELETTLPRLLGL